MNKTVIFVGGPYDGQTGVIEVGRGFYQVVENIGTRPIVPSKDPVTPINMRYVTYVPRLLCGVEVWAVDKLRPPQIVELLLERYQRNTHGKS